MLTIPTPEFAKTFLNSFSCLCIEEPTAVPSNAPAAAPIRVPFVSPPITCPARAPAAAPSNFYDEPSGLTNPLEQPVRRVETRRKTYGYFFIFHNLLPPVTKIL